MISFPFGSASLHYAGRWVDHGDSMGSNWQGSQIRFKVSGTLQLVVNAKVAGFAFAAVNIDAGAHQILEFSGNGAQSVTYALPDTGEHTVILKIGGFPYEQWPGTSYCRLVSISVDDGGAVSQWGDQAAVRLGVVGDSWMAAQNDWPFLLGIDKYSIYPVSFGGATATDLNAQYPYDGAGILNTDDPMLDAVLINSSVNDYVGGVSLEAFAASFAALVDKVRIKQPSAKIFLLQSPRNIAAGKIYDQYGPKMEEIASAREDVFYLPTGADVWESVEWSGDTYHLTFAGLQTFASAVGVQLSAYFSASRSIRVPTPSGEVEIPLDAAVLADAQMTPVIRLDDGLYRFRLADVSSPYPEGVALLDVGGGVKRISI